MPKLKPTPLTKDQRRQWLEDIADQVRDGLFDAEEGAEMAEQVKAMPDAEG